MDYKLFSFVLFSFVLTASCRNLGNAENAENATTELNVTGSWRKGRSQSNLVYVNLFSCAVRYDASCFVDAAGELFEMKKNELLAQADLEAFKVTGRADPDNSPSHLAKTIEQLLSELSGLFRDGIANFFSGKEADDEDTVVDVDDKNSTNSRDIGEYRGKKKKKMKSMMKYVAIAATVAAKVALLFKLFHASLQFKMFLIALSSLLLHLANFWLDIKKGYNPPKVVYHEQAHRNYEDDGHRRYDESEKNNAQNVAYSNHIPDGQDKSSYYNTK